MKWRSNETFAAARASGSRLRHWLLHGPAQIREGTHAGGVVGSFDGFGRPSYIYAEITGYYLLWLKGLGKTEPQRAIAESSERGVGWVRRTFFDGNVPATRIPLHGASTDWRNQAVFFFDLAMVWRGVIAHASEHAVDDLADNLAKKLRQFVHDDAIEAVLPCSDDVQLPPRWSTRYGPFLLKATSAIDQAFNRSPQPGALQLACVRHLNRCLAAADHMALDMLHPALYFAEGLVRYGVVGQNLARKILSSCLKFLRHDGALPESVPELDAADISRYRNDVTAQALRLGLLLRQMDGDMREDLSLDRMAHCLIGMVDSEGQIGFDADNSASGANTWTAMFAEQALRWYAKQDAGPEVIHPELLV